MNDLLSPINSFNTTEILIHSKVNWYVKENVSIYNKIETNYRDNSNYNINVNLGLNVFFQTKG